MKNNKFFFADYIKDKSINDNITDDFVIDRIYEFNTVSKEQIDLIDFGYSQAKPKGINLIAHWSIKSDII